jgi:serpin B
MEKIFSSPEYKNENFAISPIAIYRTLSQLANGAKGKTLSEILTILELDDLIKINNKNLHIYNEFLKLRGFKCINSLQCKYPINKNFNIINKYHGTAEKIKSIEEINEKISNQTKNKITDLLRNDNIKLSNLSLLALNAVTLKLELLYKFNKNNNKLIKFWQKEGVKIVQVMMDQRHYDYYENSLFKLIKIEYMEHLNGYFILPNNNEVSLIDCYNTFFKNKNDIRDLNFKLSLKKLQLQIPKFKIDFEIKLKSILESMGLNKIFKENSAELENISSGFNMNLNDIIQRIVIEFDESGLDDFDENKKKVNKYINDEECCDCMQIIFNRPFMYVVTLNDLFDNHDVLVVGKIEDVEV